MSKRLALVALVVAASGALAFADTTPDAGAHPQINCAAPRLLPALRKFCPPPDGGWTP